MLGSEGCNRVGVLFCTKFSCKPLGGEEGGEGDNCSRARHH